MRHEETINRMIGRWNACNVSMYERLSEALVIIEKMHEERLKLQRRIHNQRLSNRVTWEIVEVRGNYIGSPASRKRYFDLWQRHQALLAKQRELTKG